MKLELDEQNLEIQIYRGRMRRFYAYVILISKQTSYFFFFNLFSFSEASSIFLLFPMRLITTFF